MSLTGLRLQRLGGHDFRRFQGTFEVPLDADVVLVHGPNGSGKSSLVAALELAMTGAVADLQRFEADYPACLASGPDCRVTLDGRAGDESVRLVECKIGAEAPWLPWDDATRRFFANRACLTQARLGRLIQSYLAPDPVTRVPPLFRMLRTLLGLDLTANLHEGLSATGDIRHARKLAPGWQQVVDESGRAKDELQSAERRLDDAVRAEQQANATLRRLWDDACAFGPAPLPSLTVEEMRQAAQELQGSAVERREASNHQRTITLDHQRWLDSMPAVEPSAPVEQIRSRLATVDAEATDARTRLAEAVSALAEHIDGTQVPAGDAAHQLEEFLARAESIVRRHDRIIEQASEQQRRQEGLRREVATCRLELAELGADEEVEVATRTAAALAELRDQLDGDLCPTCGRDYSELHAGTLAAHLDATIALLSARANAVRTQMTTRVAARERLARAEEGLAAAMATEGSSVADVRGLREARDAVSAALASARPAAALAERERTLRAERTRLSREIVDAEARATALEARQERLRAIATIVGRDGQAANAVETDGAALVDALRAHLARLESSLAESAKQESAWGAVVAAANGVGLAADRRRAAKATRDELQARSLALTERDSRAEKIVMRARKLDKLATEADSAVIRAVVDGRLNDLLADLFARLVPDERFRPFLGDIELARRTASVSVKARRDDGVEFREVGSVLSAANLNTAALCLFLALYLLEDPHLPLLVLDDPVQAMDDIHAAGLAAVLRRLGESRPDLQLIVAIHERNLFDFLCTELGPAQPGRSLLTVELVPCGRDRGPRVDHRLWTWQDDGVHFAAGQ